MDLHVYGLGRSCGEGYGQLVSSLRFSSLLSVLADFQFCSLLRDMITSSGSVDVETDWYNGAINKPFWFLVGVDMSVECGFGPICAISFNVSSSFSASS